MRRSRVRLNGYCDARTFEYLNIVAGSGGKWNVVLLELVNDHSYDLVDVPQGLFFGSPLRNRAIPAQRWTVGVETAFIRFNHDLECVRSHKVDPGSFWLPPGMLPPLCGHNRFPILRGSLGEPFQDLRQHRLRGALAGFD